MLNINNTVKTSNIIQILKVLKGQGNMYICQRETLNKQPSDTKY